MEHITLLLIGEMEQQIRLLHGIKQKKSILMQLLELIHSVLLEL